MTCWMSAAYTPEVKAGVHKVDLATYYALVLEVIHADASSGVLTLHGRVPTSSACCFNVGLTRLEQIIWNLFEQTLLKVHPIDG